MTVVKLIKKYVGLQKNNYEMILISQVITDLRQIENYRRLGRAGISIKDR